MNKSSMTAMVSAFSRAYHSRKNEVKIFDDSMAEKFITEEEYKLISLNMSKGISFFNPGFKGNEEEALRWIVDKQLSPTPLGRAAYTERMLENAVFLGAQQYLIFAAGYDTFAYRQPTYASRLQIFEIDHPFTSQDKQKRAEAFLDRPVENLHFIQADFTEADWCKKFDECKAFDRLKRSFCSLLGISYYLSKTDFEDLISRISELVPAGSSIVFDYPDELSYTEQAGERAKKQEAMASAAGEEMKAGYGYAELERILARHGFLIYEHLSPAEITSQYFMKYNQANPEHEMTAFDNVNYCLGVKNG